MRDGLKKTVFYDGIDWMISYAAWKTRHTPEKSNHFCILLELSGSVSVNALERRAAECLRDAAGLLSGRPVRDFRCFLPVWKEGSAPPPPPSVRENRAAFDAFPNEPLPPGAAFAFAVLAEKKDAATALFFKFSHLLFDGAGAESLIGLLLGGGYAVYENTTASACDWAAVREAGRKLRDFQRGAGRKRIAVLPRRTRGKNLFFRIRLPAGSAAGIKRFSEETFGPFSFSFFVFALVLVETERLFRAMKVKGDHILIPMSVDRRRREASAPTPFFNQWSILPLSVPRSGLETPGRAFPVLRKLYFEGIGSRLPETFRTASKLMRYVPYPLIDLFVSASPGTTVGTMMFSFLDDGIIRRACGALSGAEVSNACHFPVMPPPGPLGVFANLFAGRLNLVVSTREGNIPGAELERFTAGLEERFMNIANGKGDGGT